MTVAAQRDFVLNRQKAFLRLPTFDVGVAVLDDQLGAGPVQLREGLQRGGHRVAAGNARGRRVDFDELDVLAAPPLRKVGERVAQLLEERQSEPASVLVRAGQSEVRVLPYVLHGARNGSDRIVLPMPGQLAGKPDAVGGFGKVPREGDLGAVDPGLTAQQIVIGFLGFAPLRQ